MRYCCRCGHKEVRQNIVSNLNVCKPRVQFLIWIIPVLIILGAGNFFIMPTIVKWLVDPHRDMQGNLSNEGLILLFVSLGITAICCGAALVSILLVLKHKKPSE